MCDLKIQVFSRNFNNLRKSENTERQIDSVGCWMLDVGFGLSMGFVVNEKS